MPLSRLNCSPESRNLIPRLNIAEGVRHGIPPCTRFSQLFGGLTHHDRELISLTSPSSVCATVPLPLLVSEPAPGGLDRTVITITAYLQHGRSALAG